ncbi:SET domain-containing protein [Candidatus Parcubacteria bacterium]|nr:SET domain-containing protein [Candidatus Parcubacteria bacterium]
MLVVKTKIGQSRVEGIGLFADQFIPKGTITWKFDPRFDIYFDPSKVDKMPELQKDLMIHFAYLSKKSGKYVYSIDNTRFTNHSIDPNIAEDERLSKNDEEICTVAIRDIQIGEEMTIDYRAIDAADEGSNEEYLKTIVS